MSGGCEWPRRRLSVAEYTDLRDALVGRGYLAIQPPSRLFTQEDYERWKLHFMTDTKD